MRKKIMALVLAVFMALGMTIGAVPAAADNRACVTVAQTPRKVIHHGVLAYKAPARAFCVGWGNTSRYELKSWLEYRVGPLKRMGWHKAPTWVARYGDRDTGSASWTPVSDVKKFYRIRTRAQLTIVDSKGVVLKRYGIDQSPGIDVD